MAACHLSCASSRPHPVIFTASSSHDFQQLGQKCRPSHRLVIFFVWFWVVLLCSAHTGGITPGASVLRRGRDVRAGAPRTDACAPWPRAPVPVRGRSAPYRNKSQKAKPPCSDFSKFPCITHMMCKDRLLARDPWWQFLLSAIPRRRWSKSSLTKTLGRHLCLTQRETGLMEMTDSTGFGWSSHTVTSQPRRGTRLPCCSLILAQDHQRNRKNMRVCT